MRPQFSTWVLGQGGGVPHSLPVCLTGSVQLRGQQRGATATDGRQLGLGAYSYGLAPHSLAQ